MRSGRGTAAVGWQLLAATVLRQRRPLAVLVGWSLLGALPSLVSGRLVATAVDRGFVAGDYPVGLAWLGVLALSVVVGSAGVRRVPTRLGGVVEPVRDRLVSMVVGATLHRAVAGREPPDTAVVARLTGQVETVRDSTAGLLMGLQQVVFTVVAAGAGLFWLQPMVALLVVAPVLVALGLLAYLVRYLVRRQRALLLEDEQVAAGVSEVVGAVRDIVACGGQALAFAQCGTQIDRQAGAARAVARMVAVRGAVAAFGGQLPLVAILVAAPWLLHGGHLSAGGLLGALTYVTANLQPALGSAVQTAGGSVVVLSVTLRRLEQAAGGVGTPHDQVGVTHPVATDARRPAGVDHWVDVERLGFSYAARAEPVVSELGFALRPGEHLAVVGPSGVGKSTLASLLVGLAVPQHGSVRIGGVPVGELNPEQLRRAVALIPQEAYVFAGTVRENLTYLCPASGGTDAELDAAVAAVGLEALLERLGGYDAVLRQGSGLTSGERQLVALARVWLSPARIVILDEATCHLHPAAEARAERAFRERAGTVVVIAHRLSSALRADRVLLMDGARSELGTHEELLARSALYAELVSHWYGTGAGAGPVGDGLAAQSSSSGG